jgi:Concanavalin A-like lectin/glucanases superfamily
MAAHTGKRDRAEEPGRLWRGTRLLGVIAVVGLLLTIANTAAEGRTQPKSTPGVSTAASGGAAGEWHLDEGGSCDSTSSTPDSSGNHYDATVIGACPVKGHSGGAFRFPAKWVAADGPRLRELGQDLSVRAWVRADQSPGPYRYVLAQGSGACTPAAYGMYTSFPGDPNVGGLSFYVTFRGTAVFAPGVKPGQIWDGRWHEATGTWDGSRVHFYLDGTEVGSGTTTPAAGLVDYSQPDSHFVIGSYGGPGGGACAPTVPSLSFVGDIDEVKVTDGLLYGHEPGGISLGGATPSVHTTDVDQVSANSARVKGTYDNFNYVQRVSFYVEYGTTAAYGQRTATQQLPDAASVTQVSAALTGLEPDTNYHARLVASTTDAKPGEDITFHTLNAPKPPSKSPTTTIVLEPASPTTAGYYQDFVTVAVVTTGKAPLDTRCVLDPAIVPHTFGDLALGCPFAGGGRVASIGDHSVYAASRDADGRTTALASRTFRVSLTPETTIDSGPHGETWRPDWLVYFHSSASPATFACSLDKAAFASCKSPFETGTLHAGDHSFAVRAIAVGGAVDPTPAELTFSVAGPRTSRAPCQVMPVRYWLITGWQDTVHDAAENDKTVCEIGTPGKEPCSHTANCVVKQQTCPLGARCTITTKAAWFDADNDIDWGMEASSTVGTFRPVDSSLGNVDSRFYTNPRTRSPYPESRTNCTTGYNGDRCSTVATLQVLGAGDPLLSICELNISTSPAPIGYHLPSVQAVQPLLGPGSVRRIECDTNWRIEPAPELAAVAAGRIVNVNTIAAGVLLALPSILRPGDRAPASGSAKPGPKIAAVRKVVSKAGPVAIPLKLDRAAKRLLLKSRKLAVRLQLSFRRTDGKTVTSAQVVTITAPGRQVRKCKLPMPKRGASPTRQKLPDCLLGNRKR